MKVLVFASALPFPRLEPSAFLHEFQDPGFGVCRGSQVLMGRPGRELNLSEEPGLQQEVPKQEVSCTSPVHGELSRCSTCTAELSRPFAVCCQKTENTLLRMWACHGMTLAPTSHLPLKVPDLLLRPVTVETEEFQQSSLFHLKLQKKVNRRKSLWTSHYGDKEAWSP